MTAVRFLRPAITALLCVVATAAMAADIRPYTPDGFDRLNDAGKPVVLHVTAPWCPTCKAQKPIVDALAARPQFRDITLMDIDFDSDKQALRRFKVTTQSTFVAFKGSHEVARSTGDTHPDGIEKLFDKTVN